MHQHVYLLTLVGLLLNQHMPQFVALLLVVPQRLKICSCLIKLNRQSL